MKETVLITGANGNIAKMLSGHLQAAYEVRFLTRKPKSENEFIWNLANEYIDEKALENIDYIIHLAGANISEKRWSSERKNEIINSRVTSANLILKKLKEKKIKIKAFISASAIGYYGSVTSQEIFTETSPKGNDFLSNVVDLWEKAAEEFRNEKIAERIVKIRTGVVLSHNEGALDKMATPIKYGFGSGLGSGKQYIPWIHINDLCRIYKFAIENNTIDGVYNACSPQSTTNIEFTKEIAKILKKPIFLPNIPKFILKIIFGELATVITEGSRCSSEKIIENGFIFDYPNLEKSLEDLLI